VARTGANLQLGRCSACLRLPQFQRPGALAAAELRTKLGGALK